MPKTRIDGTIGPSSSSEDVLRALMNMARLIALSPSTKAVQRLAACWGCRPCHLGLSEDTDEMIENAADSALRTGFAKTGDLVVITAGWPLYAAGTTNMLWVRRL